MPDRRQWVTMTEFARMMGRSSQWAYKYARIGYFGDFGIPVLQDCTCSSPLGGSRRRWYFLVTVDPTLPTPLP